MKMPRFAILAFAFGLAAYAIGVGCTKTDDASSQGATQGQSSTFLSRIFTVDRIYRSMQGPTKRRRVRLLDAAEPELLWVTGFKAVKVGEDSEFHKSQQFMCHSNWNVAPGRPEHDQFSRDWNLVNRTVGKAPAVPSRPQTSRMRNSQNGTRRRR